MKRNDFLVFPLFFLVAGCSFIEKKQVINFSDDVVKQYSKAKDAEDELVYLLTAYSSGQKVDIEKLDTMYSTLKKSTKDAIAHIEAQKVPKSASSKKFLETVKRYLAGLQNHVDNKLGAAVKSIKKTNPGNQETIAAVDKVIREVMKWRKSEIDALHRAQVEMAEEHGFKLGFGFE